MGGLVRALPRPRLPSIPAWPVIRRRLIIATILLVALTAGYLFWLRDSPLVAVEKVSVAGAEQDPGIETKLISAGLEQSTLNVDLAALEEAVAAEPAVRSISAQADFPHGLQISVDLREPVGYLKGAGLVVAGDGVILDRDSGRPGDLAAIKVGEKGSVGGGGVQGEALEVARVLGAAPAPLLATVERAGIDPEFGAFVQLQGGLELRFGDAGRADLKWQAAAAVIAQPSFTGATYLDLSVPDRPVAGGAEQPTATVEEAAAEASAVPAPVAIEESAPVAVEEPAPVVPEPVAVVPDPAAPAP